VSKPRPAILALADGSIWQGSAIGVNDGLAVGEVVFNTTMYGYQEVITDPSYCGQMITFSYPHIGNVGCNPEDFEATKVYAQGVIVRDMSYYPSNWRSRQSLDDFLKAHKVVGIAGIDTRALVKKITAEGAQHGCIMSGDIDQQHAIAKAQSFSGLLGVDLAKQVTTQEIYQWTSGEWLPTQGYVEYQPEQKTHIVVYDYGVKHSILRQVCQRNCRVTVVPAQTSASQVIALQPDGIVLSNGPGDPAACDYAITAAKELISAKIPLLGICLGHQILALACGLKTEKMSFGHHGANHPVQNLVTKKVHISSQNHGFTVSKEVVSKDIEITHQSLFDGTIQGFRHVHLPILSMQGHPEAGPGPHDMYSIFDDFINLIQLHRKSDVVNFNTIVNE